MEKIKCCPFCGDEAELRKGNDGYYKNDNMLTADFIVMCERCDMHTPRFTTKITINDDGTINIHNDGASMAIAAWNRREGGQDNGSDRH